MESDLCGQFRVAEPVQESSRHRFPSSSYRYAYGKIQPFLQPSYADTSQASTHTMKCTRILASTPAQLSTQASMSTTFYVPHWPRMTLCARYHSSSRFLARLIMSKMRNEPPLVAEYPMAYQGCQHRLPHRLHMPR
jgi:hypothetical protein